MHNVELSEKLWKRCQGRLEEDNPAAAYYFTNLKSWYAVPERAVILSAISVVRPLPPVPMAPQGVQRIRDWAQTLGAAVRQRSVKQETTMTRAETLPSYLYQREIQPGEPVSLERSDLGEQQEKDEEEDGMLEYDSPRSDEESAHDETA